MSQVERLWQHITQQYLASHDKQCLDEEERQRFLVLRTTNMQAAYAALQGITGSRRAAILVTGALSQVDKQEGTTDDLSELAFPLIRKKVSDMVHFKVKEIADERGLTMDDLVESSGVNYMSVRRVYWNIDCNVTITTLARLAIALQVNINALVESTNPQA